MKNKIVLTLAHGENNPRNSEGSFVTLKNGQILFAYSRFCGSSDWSDHATAEICARVSSDNGDTWSEHDTVLVPNEGGCNVMSVSLLRLLDERIALFYMLKNGLDDCRTHMRVSADEAKSWSEPVRCIPAPGYFVVNNDRIIQLRTGRLVVPAAFHRNKKKPDGKGDYAAFDSRGIAMFFLSDDGGGTWRESRDWLALPERSASGLQEPGAMELKDGRVYAYCRTGLECQYEMFSEDGCETWTRPGPSRFKSPCSPLSIKRIPKTGELLAVWNDHAPRWGLRRKKLVDGWVKDSSWGRTPLAAAVSRNDGKTWTRRKLIERDPARGFCYTAIHFTDDAVLLAYCCGGRKGQVLQDLCVRKISLAWLRAGRAQARRKRSVSCQTNKSKNRPTY